MSIPDELVKAAVKELRRCGYDDPPIYLEDSVRLAIRAAFAKLPECKEVQPPKKESFYRNGWRDCLVALAREFGGRE